MGHPTACWEPLHGAGSWVCCSEHRGLKGRECYSSSIPSYQILPLPALEPGMLRAGGHLHSEVGWLELPDTCSASPEKSKSRGILLYSSSHSALPPLALLHLISLVLPLPDPGARAPLTCMSAMPMVGSGGFVLGVSNHPYPEDWQGRGAACPQ